MKKTTATRLGSRRYLTLVIRLLVDEQGQVQQGLVVDLSGKEVGHFRQVVELPDVVGGWLISWVHKQGRDK